MKKLFVFDLETIPCDETARRLLDLDETVSYQTVVNLLKDYHMKITNGSNDFHRQPFHKIIAMSFLICDIEYTDDGEYYTFSSLKTGGRNDESEEEVLQKMCDYIGKHRPRIVSFNGKTFDIPVMQYRSMKYGIAAPWIYDKKYSYKYDVSNHCDLIDAFSNFGASARIKMHEVASLLSVPCKTNANGADVLDMYTASKIKEICDYCESDVICTYMLYLHFARHSGIISNRSFDKSMEDLNLRNIEECSR